MLARYLNSGFRPTKGIRASWTSNTQSHFLSFCCMARNPVCVASTSVRESASGWEKNGKRCKQSPHPHTITHNHTQSHTITRTHSHTITLSHSHNHTHTHTHTQSHSLTHTHSHSHTDLQPCGQETNAWRSFRGAETQAEKPPSPRRLPVLETGPLHVSQQKMRNAGFASFGPL